MPTLTDIEAARSRIAPYIVRTPLTRAAALDDILGCQVYLKLENLQHTGSFKLRGAANRMLSLDSGQKARGVVCSSSGNHAQGVAWAAARLGVDAVIVMPVNCNPVKLEAVRAMGAGVILEGTKSSERDAKVKELVKAEGRVEIHPFADPLVKAGQGTIGLEILEEEPEMDAVVVPVGGGGLIAGVATAVKSINPRTKIIGMEPAGAPRYSLSREKGSPQTLAGVSTIADGTRTDRADPQNFEVIERLVGSLVTVEDSWIRKAMKLIALKAKMVAEPSSAMGIAAALAGDLPVCAPHKVCFIISGGNVDPALLISILSEN